MKKSLIIVLVIVGILLIGGGVSVYYLFGGEESNSGGGRILENPVKDLTDDEAVSAFNADFVLYLLYSIGTNELHNPPFSDNTPKIEVAADGEVFNAEVLDGRIYVGSGEIASEDIVIRTTKSEIVKMLRDRNYVVESFRNENSGIEFVEGKVTLAI